MCIDQIKYPEEYGPVILGITIELVYWKVSYLDRGRWSSVRIKFSVAGRKGLIRQRLELSDSELTINN